MEQTIYADLHTVKSKIACHAVCKDAERQIGGFAYNRGMSAREDHIKFVNRLCSETKLSPSALARKAKVASSNVTRFIGGRSSQQSLSTRILNALAVAAGYESYEDALNKQHPKNEGMVRNSSFDESSNDFASIEETADVVDKIILPRGMELNNRKYLHLVVHIQKWHNMQKALGRRPTNDDILFEVATTLERINKQLTN